MSTQLYYLWEEVNYFAVQIKKIFLLSCMAFQEKRTGVLERVLNYFIIIILITIYISLKVGLVIYMSQIQSYSYRF